MVETLVVEGGLTLESGAHLAPLEIAYARYGDPSHPVVYICHALTGDAEAAVWWDTLIGPGKVLDTDRFHVVCANLLGGCMGTTGPSSTNPATGEPYGTDFPLFTMRDLVAVHRTLLRALEIERVDIAVGGSLGGMQILQWSLDFPGEIDRAVLVCASSRLTAQNIAFSKVARHAILTHDAMDVARMMAHITYLSEEGMERKFQRARRVPDADMTLHSDFEVEHYLDHQAKIFLARFDPGTYLYLSRVMDYYDAFADERPQPPTTKYLLVSFSSDWRFGTDHSVAIQRQLKTLGADSTHHEVESPWGHDSFLMNVPEYHRLVKEFVYQDVASAL
ncbi:homoserine O-acetyltransferase [Solirubrobacter sp. CPCC 204708]|uniref:Homoserine O-succinyltransferase n=1 Tax=Solirubrobacter deserti TaxID=2282478 RepID=A0ABT4RD30_9ACTN|nr:homoserine O-acetyltransferase [Solirubrobacter deserti]MBE2317779.1 homoserine O-acetyltransferase [Solirubrobacter deserti]MDA0136444.1 homoserine O-acetyltransferase [Solirubrobacter deserti]